MKTLVQFGAPEQILIDGKPHLGTDRLVPLLRNFRQHLQDLGVSSNRLLILLKINSCHYSFPRGGLHFVQLAILLVFLGHHKVWDQSG